MPLVTTLSLWMYRVSKSESMAVIQAVRDRSLNPDEMLEIRLLQPSQNQSGLQPVKKVEILHTKVDAGSAVLSITEHVSPKPLQLYRNLRNSNHYGLSGPRLATFPGDDIGNAPPHISGMVSDPF